ncbi:septum site-determining protein Ssd [Gordonia bronchialis]|uniref:septum site-determining protein Ssd n=1 Tax=Gordonia bronchialis TaxID=2054 RepID=UPI00242D4FF1|nr:septum site-determining protein Ssd [Gordonia bronchialis]
MTDDLLALVGPDLLDDAARCAAAAGYRMIVADAADCRRAWLTSRAVLVDPAALDLLTAARPPRRDGVILVTGGEPPPRSWRLALDLGAADVLTLPGDDGRLVRLLSELRAPRRSPAGAVALMPAHGGAGASVLAVAVGLTAARSSTRTLLLDLDDLGPGADLLLGIEDRSGLRWGDLSLEGGAVVGGALHHALPKAEEMLSVLASRGDDPRPPRADAVTAVIDAGRGNGDLVVIDLPRTEGAVTRAAIESVDLVVLVTTPTVLGCAAARRTVGRLLGDSVRVELCIRGPSPGGLRAGQVADAVGLPLLAAYRPDPRMAARLESGRPRVTPRNPLGRAAEMIYRRAAPTERAVA